VLMVEVDVTVPYGRGDLISAIHQRGEIISEEYVPEGTSIHARVDAALAQQIREAT
jgi:GTP-binding protein HflX